ncbi:hypothetical protein GGF46_000986 [Coemansia sp. RSA 552]|nr:hypothetical protein GGF46_000986 [Coemansia sp. RSA 552]
MMGSAFFSKRAAVHAAGDGCMPPPNWCAVTLNTLTNKYEHLTSEGKANPPYAEAVLNCFKAKLMDVVPTQRLYASSEACDGESEWQSSDGCPPYMAMKAEDNTSNYISIPPAAIADSASTGCYDEYAKPMDTEEAAAAMLSPTDDEAAGNAGVGAASETTGLASNDEMVLLPPSIEEALRRFLANNNSQVLSDTFTTFVAADDASSGDAALDRHDTSADDDEASEQQPDSSAFVGASQGTDESDSCSDEHSVESGSCSPESVDSPEEPLEYMSPSDPVDVFVKGFDTNGSWEAMPQHQTADGSLIPCKRKHAADSDDQVDASAVTKTIPRSTPLPVSPRKRSRSAGRNDVAAVPRSASPTPVATPSERPSSPAAAA